jgi:hypothetical protein
LGVLALTVQAKAATFVYLVGIRHIYAVPAYPDVHQEDRQQIEEDYAASVAEAQKHYDADMASIHEEEAKDSGSIHQNDRDAVQENLEKDLAEASDRREGALSQIYQTCDSVRVTHPEFKVDQDGPYKVVEVESAPTGEYTNVVYYQPYPAYIEPCPYGWVWGQPYPFVSWGVQIRIGHNLWITLGSPFYEPMYYGGGVYVFDAPVRREVIIERGGWYGGRPPHINEVERTVIYRNYSVQRKSGYFERGPGGRPLTEFKRPSSTFRPSGVSRYSSSAGVSRSGNTAGTSRYSQTGASRYGGSTTTATGTSRYSHTPDSLGSAATGTSRYGRSGGTTVGSAGSVGTATTTGSSRYGRTNTSTAGTSTTSTTSRYNRTLSGSSGYSRTTTSGSTGGSTTSRPTQTGGSATTTTTRTASTPVSHGSTGSTGSSSTGGSTTHTSTTTKTTNDPPKKKG